MDSIAPFLTYAAALAIAAAIPGPGIAALVGQSLGGNLRVALFFLGGMALGDVAYLTVAIVGLAAVAQAFAGAFIVIKIAGGLYLLYLAWMFWTSEARRSKIQSAGNRSAFAAFLAGLAVTISNPKTIVFYLALLPTVLNLSTVGAQAYVTLAILTVVILYATLTPYVLLASKARSLMTRPAALRRLNRIAAGTIGTAGALILGEATLAAFRRS